MFFIGVLIYVAAEIASFVLVVEQIGLLWALLILIAVSALGPFIVRRVGLSVLVRTQDRLARGEVPTRELLDGLMILIGGVMICVPGFVGDALGMLLMIGPVRHLVTRVSGHGLAWSAEVPHGSVDDHRRPVPFGARRRCADSRANPARGGTPRRRRRLSSGRVRA